MQEGGDYLADCLTVAAQAAIFDLVLLTGAAAPISTCSLTCYFLVCFLFNAIASCVTLGRSCSCTLGAGRAPHVMERVCLAASLSGFISVVTRWVGMSLLSGDGSTCCGEGLLLLCLVVGCTADAGIAPCSAALLASCCSGFNWCLSNLVPLLLVPLRAFAQAYIACIILVACVTVGLVMVL